jgi:hypothetical protein
MFNFNLENPAPAPKFNLLETVTTTIAQPQRMQGMFYWRQQWQYWLTGAKVYFPEYMLKGNDYRKIFQMRKVKLDYDFGTWVNWHGGTFKIIGAKHNQNDWHFVVQATSNDWGYASRENLSPLLSSLIC